MKRRYVCLIFVVILIVGVIVFFKNFYNQGVQETLEEYDIVKKGNVSKRLESTGVVSSNFEEITSNLSGKIIEDNVTENKMVKKGDLLYKIDPTSIQTNINSLQHEIIEIENEYESIRASNKNNTIKSSMNGIITTIKTSVGADLKEGDVVGSIINKDKLMIVLKVDDTSELYVRKEVEILVGNDKVSGIISFIDGEEIRVNFNRSGDQKEGDQARVFINSIEYSGLIVYYDEIDIISEVSGRVTNINVKENDNVNISDILLIVNNKNSNMIKKYNELIKKKDELNKLKESLNDTNIYATMDGLVIQKQVSLNNVYDGTSSMCTIVGDNNYKITMNVSEKDLLYIKVGQEVNIKSDIWGEKVQKGNVETISTIPNEDDYFDIENLSYYPITISFDNINNLSIFNGMHVILSVLIAEKNDVLTVDNNAVLRGNYVFRVIDPMTRQYEKVDVTIGISDNERVEIVSGLKENDEVIVYNYEKDEEYYEY